MATTRSTPAGNSIAWPLSQEGTIFIGLLVFRLVNSFTIKTFFQPDEYFQALEPAWQVAFGNESGAWITWEWRTHLRSSLHPMLFGAVYRQAWELSNAFFHDSPAAHANMMIAAPKAAQAAIAAIGDLCTWLLARKIYGGSSRASYAALALTVLSPWQWYCSVRTFSNSLETVLTVAALYYWPWGWFVGQAEEPSKERNSKRDGEDQHPNGGIAVLFSDQGTAQLSNALACAALATIFRPTNIIIWATISTTLLYRHGNRQRAYILTQNVAIVGGVVLLLSICVDRFYYGAWTLPPLNFLYFNVVNGLSAFYGTNRLDYYFTEGLPLLLITALPFAGIGLWQSLRFGPARVGSAGHAERQTSFALATAVLVTVFAFTMLAHKEVRFLYPLLPILHVLAAQPLATFFRPFPFPASRPKQVLLVAMLAVNVFVAGYVSLVHQRGVVDVMHFLRHEQESRYGGTTSTGGMITGNVTVGFFMPCHSTPWRSHLVHPEIEAWALTCEPPLGLSVEEREVYLDEADVFYADPGTWVEANMESRGAIAAGMVSSGKEAGDGWRRKWPEYLAFFEQLEPVMERILDGTRYTECWRGFNTHWHDDGRRHGDVVVWCLR